MKVNELLQEGDALEELEHLMLLRSTESHISQKNAEEVQAFLHGHYYNVRAISGERTKKNPGLGRRHLKIMSPSWNVSSWRSGSGAVERYAAEKFLRDHGFKVGRWDMHVLAGKDVKEYDPFLSVNSPHVYFW